MSRLRLLRFRPKPTPNTSTLVMTINPKPLFVALLLLLARPAWADNTWLYALPASGHVADYLSSVTFSSRPGSVCIEGNPLVRHPDLSFDARKGAVWTAAVIGGEWVAIHQLSRSDKPKVRVIAKVLAISAGSLGWTLATRNLMIADCDRGIIR